MPNITVRFQHIGVSNDGEALDKGKLYWDFAVDGESVSSRTVSSPYVVASGGTVPLGQSITVQRDKNDVLSITGFLAEKDGGLSGHDDQDVLDHQFRRADGWGAGTQHKRFVDRKLDCTLTYTIDVH